METMETGFGAGEILVGIVLFAVGFYLYFLPTITAINRKSVSAVPIGVANLLFGWTIIGWFVLLALAKSANKK